MQQLCEGTTALHDTRTHSRPDIMAIHPVVRLHQRLGVSHVNEHFTRRIVEMNVTESDAVLGYLTGWVKNPPSPCATTEPQGPLHRTTAAPSTLS